MKYGIFQQYNGRGAKIIYSWLEFETEKEACEKLFELTPEIIGPDRAFYENTETGCFFDDSGNLIIKKGDSSFDYDNFKVFINELPELTEEQDDNE